MLICQSFIFLGAQFMLYGISSYGFTNLLEYDKEEDRFYHIFKNFTIEKGIIFGAAVFLIGSIISVVSGVEIYKYMATTSEFLFKADVTKWGIFGISLVILGLQIVVSSLYLCLFNIKIITN